MGESQAGGAKNPMSDHSHHEQRITETLRVAWSREQAAGRDPVYTRTPLDEMIAREEGEVLEEHLIRLEAFRRLMSIFFADGPHPSDVMRRVYAFAKALRPELILNMSCEEVGAIFGETKASVSYRIKQLVNRPIMAHSGHGTQLPWQKSSSACATYAARAKGNTNRRKVSRKHKPTRKSTE